MPCSFSLPGHAFPRAPRPDIPRSPPPSDRRRYPGYAIHVHVRVCMNYRRHRNTTDRRRPPRVYRPSPFPTGLFLRRRLGLSFPSMEIQHAQSTPRVRSALSFRKREKSPDHSRKSVRSINVINRLTHTKCLFRKHR